MKIPFKKKSSKTKILSYKFNKTCIGLMGES